MNLERFCIKFFARPQTTLDDALFITIFHEWIRDRKLKGTLLDVADYRHVPTGPGVMLITHQINFALDYNHNQFGLLAQRKTGLAPTHQGRILELVQATKSFATLLQADWRVAQQFSLEAGTFHYISNDRLLAPNTETGFNAIKPDLEKVVNLIYPSQTISITRVNNDPRERLTIAVSTETAINIENILPVESAVR